MIERQPLTLPDRLNHTWSMDFVMDALAHGRRIKCLTIVDDFTNECLDIPVAHEISGDQVVRTLDGIAAFRGYPKAVSARSAKPGCVFGHSRQVSSMLQVQGATGNQGCLCSGAEKTEVPLARAFSGGMRPPPDARWRVPPSADLQALLTSGTVDEAVVHSRVHRLLDRMNREGRLSGNTTYGDIGPVMNEIFSSPGVLDQAA